MRVFFYPSFTNKEGVCRGQQKLFTINEFSFMRVSYNQRVLQLEKVEKEFTFTTY
jgi:hypothetical protein